MNKKKESYQRVSAETVAALHGDYLARLGKKADALAAAVALPHMKAAMVDFYAQLARLRVSDDGAGDLVAYLNYMKTQPADVLAQALEIRLEKVTAAVSQRERGVSQYGDAEVPEKDMAMFNAAAAARPADAVLDRLFDGGDRIYLHLPKTVTPLEKQVAAVLKKMPAPRKGDADGYTISSWSAGTATDASGKQTFKIGRLLNKHAPEILKDYENRVTDNLLVVISRRASDIARASTNRGWHSCAGPRGAGAVMAYGQMESSIREGMMVAYLIHDRDPDINDPLARVMINQFVPDTRMDNRDGRLINRFARVMGRGVGLADWPKGERVYFCGKMHGLGPDIFPATVTAFLEDTLNAGAAGSFWLKKGIYRDAGVQNVERNRGRTRKLKRNWD